MNFVNFLGILTIPLVFVFYRAAVDTSHNLSQQGCQLPWMYPTYILQNEFNQSRSPLASRYSLWLYREAGWEFEERRGVPVLFIPGHAGSSRQVRSIASSAARQFYSEPYTVSPDLAKRSLKPLDFFTVEFNEDFSALHGPTIDSQVAYCSSAITFILDHYPPGTTIVIIGHSMGGIIATSLLPSKDISAIITMSTPHTLPPARFDSRIDRIYGANHHTLLTDPTPIISLCGGATDMMIVSESCILPTLEPGSEIYRRSVFTSALEGAWTGVGHREAVWCHQVRWRVAKAALELGAARSAAERGLILDTWLRDGQVLPPVAATSATEFWPIDPGTYEILPPGTHLERNEPRGSSRYLLPIPQSSAPSKFVLFVSGGSIPPVSPYHPYPLRTSVRLCSSTSVSEPRELRCAPLHPETLKLIPNPPAKKVFPVPLEGSDESEGVVLFEAEIPPPQNPANRWIGVVVEDADGRGWIAGGLDSGVEARNEASVWSPFLGTLSLPFPDRPTLRISVSCPNLLSNALVVYRLTPKGNPSGDCTGSPLSPLISHMSRPSEAQYYPLIHSPLQKILLHTHGSAPYIPRLQALTNHGINFVVYSSSFLECKPDISALEITVDWWSTIGRCAARYPTTLASWAVGVAALVVFGAWRKCDQTGLVPSVQQSLAVFSARILPKLLVTSFFVSFVRFPVDYYLGNEGHPMFAPLAPLLLLVATGMVCVSWWTLEVLMWSIGKVGVKVFGRRKDDITVRRSAVVSMALLFLLIFVFIPWQVAFLGSWLIHLYTCASSKPLELLHGGPVSNLYSPSSEFSMRLAGREFNQEGDSKTEEVEKHVRSQKYCRTNNYHHNTHILLLMMWLLPLAAPVLAVWVKTLLTAGFTTPFSGDHFFPNVAPFLILTDFASWTAEPLFKKHRFESLLPVRWSLIIWAISAFFFGPRRPYIIFDVAKVSFGLMVLLRIGPRYWGSRT